MPKTRLWQQPSAPLTLALAVLLSILGLWWWLSASRAVVELITPSRGDAAEVVYATGVVEPESWAKVVALQRKRIVEMCRCEGDRVKKGDVLARLDDVQEQALLTEMQARRDTIADEVERYQQLVDRNAISRTALDEKRTQLAEIEARIAAQTDRIADLELRAPMDGLVLRSDGEVGEIAGTGSNDELFWVGQPKPLKIEAEVNEEDIAKVAAGQAVLLRHEGHASGPLHASVASITPKGNPSTKTFRVDLALPDDTPLMIGMSVEANIIVREKKDVLLAPAESLRNGTVLVVRSGRIAEQPVSVGIRGARMVEIVSGLEEGQKFVAEPGNGLEPGQRVRAKDAPAP